MNDKQRSAIGLLNRLLKENHLDESEYFFLMDFIVENNNVTYVPTYPTYPYITWDTKPIPVTCNKSTTTSLNKEEL